MKVFISQPMKGKTEKEIREERAEIIVKLMNKYPNIEILDNLIFAEEEPENDRKALKLLTKSLFMLAEADLVCMAEGWTKSRGCKIEFDIAREYYVPIMLDGVGLWPDKER